jgi:hypothetical protein
MTNNTTQAVLDGVDILRGAGQPDVRGRFLRTTRSIAWFAGGCAAAAIHYYFVQLFLSVVLPVAVTTTIVIARQREPNLNADAYLDGSMSPTIFRLRRACPLHDAGNHRAIERCPNVSLTAIAS